MQNIIRENVKNLRKSLDIKDVESLSITIQDKVLSLTCVKNANTFMVYNSFGKEVKTDKIINELLNQNKTVAFPITIENYMVAGVPTSTEYKKSSLGVLEPTSYTVLENPNVIIIPLVACDVNKNRIGMGKGYYDRYLKGKNCLKIGICYDFQVVEGIIPNETDVPLDIIITEKRTLL